PGLPAQRGGVRQLAGGAERVRHQGQVGADVQQHQVGTLPGTGDGTGPAEAAGRPGDDDCLPGQPHRTAPHWTAVRIRSSSGSADSTRYMWPPGSSARSKSWLVALAQPVASSALTSSSSRPRTAVTGTGSGSWVRSEEHTSA